jgi:hypothetical protein
MSDTTASLRHKLKSASDLQSVVRTMKSLAASSIVQYEQSVRALGDDARAVELGLGICFQGIGHADALIGEATGTDAGAIGAVVFGSDQELVGQFNDLVADHAVKTLKGLTDRLGDQSRSQLRVWAVCERVQACRRAWLTPVCRWSTSSTCRVRSRALPRWSQRFWWTPRRTSSRVNSARSTSSTTDPARRGAVRCHCGLRGTRRPAAINGKPMIQPSRQE